MLGNWFFIGPIKKHNNHTVFTLFFSFFFQSERGINPQTQFVFDLELPHDYVPSNNDGEVDEFRLVPASEVLEKICDPQMKTTSCAVTLDFLIRRGILTLEKGKIFLLSIDKKPFQNCNFFLQVLIGLQQWFDFFRLLM